MSVGRLGIPGAAVRGEAGCDGGDGHVQGGSSFYYATLMDLQRRGRVLTVDIEDYPGKPQHDRITHFLGASTSPEILSKLRAAIAPSERVMVTLDSDHHAAHVAEELRLYSELVTPGSYLIVEDTHFNGRPILPGFGPGPYEAVEAFSGTHPNFERDRSREKYGITFNPGGWLKRACAEGRLRQLGFRYHDLCAKPPGFLSNPGPEKEWKSAPSKHKSRTTALGRLLASRNVPLSVQDHCRHGWGLWSATRRSPAGRINAGLEIVKQSVSGGAPPRGLGHLRCFPFRFLVAADSSAGCARDELRDANSVYSTTPSGQTGNAGQELHHAWGPEAPQ
ncbi:MAG: cephalosporin hydroxylase family protein [Anaerotruncus sp.]|nr:cephalosporin hydroxylase family protein [Anaerotruncus sp.]